ncbi:hypothetical protein [Frateuria aurantia]|uniref:Uncharacterized protein n=1 Tax=Frateuria aurantia (strain ATCC 33424 / DSM 6220 / KCTC 2777 / LMG 1558 / NBRC 3245 / NCIMB 13370) TaxID=767434 RepID=H8L3A0_FRAAD|nr:hypothetical protein [Frateuria aurantia]AFC85536.1 hypothetical protein Fraau_1075 [Frateuria aurantia DSM 6220]
MLVLNSSTKSLCSGSTLRFGGLLAVLLSLAGCAVTPEQLQRNLRMQQALDARYRCPQLEPVTNRPTYPPAFKVPQAERDAMAAMGNPCAATW